MLASLLSFIAILALAALNWWLGRSARLTRDAGDAATRIRLDLIDFDEREADAANAGRAHVALGARPADLAVAVAMGDGWVTRRFGPGGLRRVLRDGSRLELYTPDFTLPHLDLRFDTAEQAHRWENRFAGLVGATSAMEGIQ